MVGWIRRIMMDRPDGFRFHGDGRLKTADWWNGKRAAGGREIIQAKVCIIRNRKANREQMWPSEVKSVLFPRPRCCCWVHWPVSRSNKRRNESRWLDSRLVAAPSWLAAPSFLSFFLKVDLSTFFLLAGPLVPLSFLSLSTSVGDWANGRQ